MKAWLWWRTRIWPKCDVNRSQRPMTSNEGSHIAYITDRETSEPRCAERDFWAICPSQSVQVDWPVSYPFIFIYLSHGQHPQMHENVEILQLHIVNSNSVSQETHTRIHRQPPRATAEMIHTQLT